MHGINDLLAVIDRTLSISVQEVKDWVIVEGTAPAPVEEISNSESEEATPAPAPKITSVEAIKCTNTLLEYADENELDAETIFGLLKLRAAAIERSSQTVQSKITSFFFMKN